MKKETKMTLKEAFKRFETEYRKENKMTPWTIGDVCVLNSGGPLMTITKIERGHYDNEEADCEWISDGHRLCATFPTVCIRKPKPSES